MALMQHNATTAAAPRVVPEGAEPEQLAEAVAASIQQAANAEKAEEAAAVKAVKAFEAEDLLGGLRTLQTNKHARAKLLMKHRQDAELVASAAAIKVEEASQELQIALEEAERCDRLVEAEEKMVEEKGMPKLVKSEEEEEEE